MTPSFVWKTAAWFAYLMFLTLAGNAAEVRLKSRATTRSPLVRLGEIADVEDDDDGVAQHLASLPLFPAPANGKPRVVSRSEVQQILAMHEVKLRLVNLHGAEEVTVSSIGTGDKSSKPANVKSVIAKPVIAKPAIATASATVSDPSETPAAEEQKMVKVAVAMRPLRSGEPLTAADIEWKPVAAEMAIGREQIRPEELLGKELKRPLSAGHAIDPSLLQSPRLVHRGEMVTVRSVAPGIVVTARGRATEEGGRGDVVAIDLLDTREKLLARVTDRQVVEVYAGSPRYETQNAGK